MKRTPKRKIQDMTPEQEAAAIKEIEAMLLDNRQLFERVNAKGDPDPNGEFWQATTHH